MHRSLPWLWLLCWLAAVAPAGAATGQVFKVLPHFLDTNGVHALSPSLYERDAYQAYLRQHPDKRSGIRFDVQWKARPPVTGTLRLIIEMRGIAEGNLPRQIVQEKIVQPTGRFSQWNQFVLSGRQYKLFGEVTAWRVSLWDEDDLVAEQKSFLW
jgi:hypothetical protein